MSRSMRSSSRKSGESNALVLNGEGDEQGLDDEHNEMPQGIRSRASRKDSPMHAGPYDRSPASHAAPSSRKRQLPQLPYGSGTSLGLGLGLGLTFGADGAGKSQATPSSSSSQAGLKHLGGLGALTWSPEEDALLATVVSDVMKSTSLAITGSGAGAGMEEAGEEGFGVDWHAVSLRVPRRTAQQCMSRWVKALKAGGDRGPWTEEEDDVIRSHMAEAGGDPNAVRWAAVAAHLPGRLGKQCRERWQNHLDPGIVKGPFTSDEDKLLFEAQRELGNKWSEIAKRVPARNENAVKNRWNSNARRKWFVEQGIPLDEKEIRALFAHAKLPLPPAAAGPAALSAALSDPSLLVRAAAESDPGFPFMGGRTYTLGVGWTGPAPTCADPASSAPPRSRKPRPSVTPASTAVSTSATSMVTSAHAAAASVNDRVLHSTGSARDAARSSSGSGMVRRSRKQSVGHEERTFNTSGFEGNVQQTGVGEQQGWSAMAATAKVPQKALENVAAPEGSLQFGLTFASPNAAQIAAALQQLHEGDEGSAVSARSAASRIALAGSCEVVSALSVDKGQGGMHLPGAGTASTRTALLDAAAGRQAKPGRPSATRAQALSGNASGAAPAPASASYLANARVSSALTATSALGVPVLARAVSFLIPAKLAGQLGLPSLPVGHAGSVSSAWFITLQRQTPSTSAIVSGDGAGSGEGRGVQKDQGKGKDCTLALSVPGLCIRMTLLRHPPLATSTSLATPAVLEMLTRPGVGLLTLLADAAAAAQQAAREGKIAMLAQSDPNGSIANGGSQALKPAAAAQLAASQAEAVENVAPMRVRASLLRGWTHVNTLFSQSELNAHAQSLASAAAAAQSPAMRPKKRANRGQFGPDRAELDSTGILALGCGGSDVSTQACVRACGLGQGLSLAADSRSGSTPLHFLVNTPAEYTATLSKTIPLRIPQPAAHPFQSVREGVLSAFGAAVLLSTAGHGGDRGPAPDETRAHSDMTLSAYLPTVRPEDPLGLAAILRTASFQTERAPSLSTGAVKCNQPLSPPKTRFNKASGGRKGDSAGAALQASGLSAVRIASARQAAEQLGFVVARTTTSASSTTCCIEPSSLAFPLLDLWAEASADEAADTHVPLRTVLPGLEAQLLLLAHLHRMGAVLVNLRSGEGHASPHCAAALLCSENVGGTSKSAAPWLRKLPFLVASAALSRSDPAWYVAPSQAVATVWSDAEAEAMQAAHACGDTALKACIRARVQPIGDWDLQDGDSAVENADEEDGDEDGEPQQDEADGQNEEAGAPAVENSRKQKTARGKKMDTGFKFLSDRTPERVRKRRRADGRAASESEVSEDVIVPNPKRSRQSDAGGTVSTSTAPPRPRPLSQLKIQAGVRSGGKSKATRSVSIWTEAQEWDGTGYENADSAAPITHGHAVGQSVVDHLVDAEAGRGMGVDDSYIDEDNEEEDLLSADVEGMGSYEHEQEESRGRGHEEPLVEEVEVLEGIWGQVPVLSVPHSAPFVSPRGGFFMNGAGRGGQGGPDSYGMLRDGAGGGAIAADSRNGPMGSMGAVRHESYNAPLPLDSSGAVGLVDFTVAGLGLHKGPLLSSNGTPFAGQYAGHVMQIDSSGSMGVGDRLHGDGLLWSSTAVELKLPQFSPADQNSSARANLGFTSSHANTSGTVEEGDKSGLSQGDARSSTRTRSRSVAGTNSVSGMAPTPPQIHTGPGQSNGGSRPKSYSRKFSAASESIDLNTHMDHTPASPIVDGVSLGAGLGSGGSSGGHRVRIASHMDAGSMMLHHLSPNGQPLGASAGALGPSFIVPPNSGQAMASMPYAYLTGLGSSSSTGLGRPTHERDQISSMQMAALQHAQAQVGSVHFNVRGNQPYQQQQPHPGILQRGYSAASMSMWSGPGPLTQSLFQGPGLGGSGGQGSFAAGSDGGFSYKAQVLSVQGMGTVSGPLPSFAPSEQQHNNSHPGAVPRQISWGSQPGLGTGAGLHQHTSAAASAALSGLLGATPH